MTFTIHRGTKEIGGSCVEVCTKTSRLIVDFGLPLVNNDKTPFDSSGLKDASVQNLVNQKILPDISALYDEQPDKNTAVAISHAHQDHYGLIDFVNKKIPVYLGKATHKIIELTDVFAGRKCAIGTAVYFENEKPFVFGDIEVTPYLMDHAAFDAYAFLIRAEGQSLFYSGDFRAHGRKYKLFYRFLFNAPQNIDWLLMEGTTISRTNPYFPSEAQLENDFVATFKSTGGINLIHVSGQNIDRLVTIDRACKRCGKIFVLDFYTANVLEELASFAKLPHPSANFPEIKVFFPERLSKRMEKLRRKDLMDRFRKYEISREQISAQADKIVMIVRPSMDSDLEFIHNLEGGTFIYSMWEGYKEQQKTADFLSGLVNRDMINKSIHTSGHADMETLRKMVNALHAKVLIPIHTFGAEKYKEHFPDADIRLAHDGELIGIEDAQEKKQADAGPEESSLLGQIIKIGEQHEKAAGLPDSVFDKAPKQINFVCDKLNITKLQAVLFSDVCYLFEGGDVDLNTIASFMHCKSIKIVEYLEEFEALEEKGFIAIQKESGHFRHDNGIFFEIPYSVIDSMRKNAVPEKPYSKILSIDEFLSAVYNLCENRIQRIEPYETVIKQMSALLERNKHLGLVKKLKSYSLSKQNELIVLRFCHWFVDLEEEEMDIDIIEGICDRASGFRSDRHQLKAGTHPLQQKQIIENVNDGGFADINQYRLTETAKESLLFEVEAITTKKTVKDLMDPNAIVEKQLFYPEKTSREIKELIETLDEEKLFAAQSRLKEQGLRTGFACLFSGAPGTGKTETAYQIAKKTGRGIMMVDISETKSMWFGESEKIIKKIFTKYRNAIKYSEKIPILLFNEADAIISKRQDLSNDRGGPGQTENAIQNIILQEIENLNGILIATTNLMQNMDKAFERRFLYKIDFEKPTCESRSSIWQTLIPELSAQDAGILAERFEFSGGQIENIARRRTVAMVLSGTEPSLEKLLEYCKQELPDTSEMKQIGFKI